MILSDYSNILCVLLLITSIVLTGCVSETEEITQQTHENVPENPPETDESGPFTAAEIQQLELLILNQTNTERKSQGLEPLMWNDSLATISDYHAWQMAKKDFRGHIEPDGDSHVDRVRQYGVQCTNDNTGEVIAFVQSSNESTLPKLANKSVVLWMDSESHRSGILNVDFSHSGVGVYSTESGRLLIVQVLCGGVDYL